MAVDHGNDGENRVRGRHGGMENREGVFMIRRMKDLMGRVFGTSAGQSITKQQPSISQTSPRIGHMNRYVKRLERQLDQIWVGNSKLRVNCPRFQLNTGRDEKEKNSQYKQKPEGRINFSEAVRVQGRSYVDAVLGERKGEQNQQKKENNKERRQIWQVKSSDTSWTGLEFKSNQEECKWLDGFFVGMARSVEIVPVIQERMYMEGMFSVRVKAMGGKMVLIDGEDKDELKHLMESAADWFSQWFEEICPWTPTMVAKERFVWLKIMGVPLSVWGDNFFSTISNLWGKFISLDDSTRLKKRFDVARVLVSTTLTNNISRVLMVKVDGQFHNIVCREEDGSNGFFNLKTDYNLDSQSNSDDEDIELWSTDHYSGEEFDEANHASRSKNQVNWSEEDGGEEEADMAIGKAQEIQKFQIVDETPSSSYAEHINELGGGSGESDSSKEQGLSVVKETQMAGAENLITQQCDHEEVVGVGPDNEVLQGDQGDMNKTDQSLGQIVAQPVSNGTGERLMENGPKANVGLLSLRPAKGNQDRIHPQEQIDEAEDAGVPADDGNDARGDDSFWAELSSDSGPIADWISRFKRSNLRKKKQRKKKSRACMSVYKDVRTVVMGKGKKSREGRLKAISTQQGGLPKFFSNAEKPVAGESISDGAIINCNKRSRARSNSNSAKEIWNFAKEIGLTATGDEQIIIQQIEEMENRDKERVGSHREKEGGIWVEEDIAVNLVNVYAPCDVKERRMMFDELKLVITNKGGCWCLMGDFNITRNQQEKSGDRGVSNGMRVFNEFIRDMELVDLPLIGRKFTWYKPNGEAMSRLDRFLMTEDWMSKWVNSKQWGLKRSISDHCPILLKSQHINWGPKPFKFFDEWLLHQECKTIVEEEWKKTNVQGWKGFCVKEKLKAVKQKLKKWSAEEFTQLDLKINEAKEKIASLDRMGELKQLSDAEIMERKQLFMEVWSKLKIKEGMYKQKARKAWLKNGDANSKYFHRCIKSRQRRNEINCIEINGKQLVGVEEVKDGIAKHFQNFFQKEKWVRPVLDGVDFKQISSQQAERLSASFSEDEIKKAVWDCSSSKAPGPDGFNFRFFREFWETIKKDVVGFLQEFQKYGKLVSGLNASFITLIPKVSNPQKIEEYRPISLIGAMYKIVAKLLANRLKEVISYVIGEHQMAFVEGRQLTEAVVMANEIIDEARKKNLNSFILKMDFEKAYDKVSWSFLDYMMSRFGFDKTWRGWILECLQTSSVSVLVNGSPTREFTVSRGLKQGDPLSPFLFLMVAEGLNGLIHSAIRKNLFQGVAVGYNGVSFSHIQFADDTILFGKATESNVWAAKCILRSFELVSGLKINFSKSQLMSINMEEEWTIRMSYLLNCQIGVIPFKYLGMLVGGNHRRVSFWQTLVDSLKKKLAGWKGKWLSFGGRITLLNSVLTSLPVFLLSVFLAPKNVVRSIEKIRRDFLWGGCEDTRKVHWVNWEKVCKGKHEGGLGVKSIRAFNLALLGKWWGKLAKGEAGLWSRLIKEKYGAGNDSWLSWVKNGRGEGSSWWKDVCRIDVLGDNRNGWLSNGFEIIVGDGDGISFWWDSWCKDGVLAHKFPRLYMLSAGMDYKIKQMGVWIEDKWRWMFPWRRVLLDRESQARKELEKMLEATKLHQGRKDKWDWKYSMDGSYTTSTGYANLAASQEQSQKHVFGRVWNPNAPSKVCGFSWQLLLNRIPTKTNLFKRGIIKDPAEVMCSLCKEYMEDCDHLFLSCKITTEIWNRCLNWWGVQAVLASNVWDGFRQHEGIAVSKRMRVGWEVVWFALVWTIWLTRNEVLFNNKIVDKNKLFDLVQVRSFHWLTNRGKVLRYSFSDWLLNPHLCNVSA
ncbi:hypothetical protein SLEP1_g43906 [Rubroshorea leprosula]|uniref:Reverse transcriptase domain-containing protein n=1 Tax=Rubroshorea leprosula TaxID=152421 RepID=A0AAV5LEJ6_9ROSI|nr:hypothetical protein SLEP1_g43906 [Rubroshorea leprosula]